VLLRLFFHKTKNGRAKLPCQQTKTDLVKAVDNGPGRWEYSHMETTLVKADDKGRVSVRGTRKGAKYLVTAENGGWWIMPAPKITVPEKMDSPAGAWELRAATLESFYDKSKAW
jgi:hypothetical protein